MGDVVEFKPKLNGRHASGIAVCEECNHEWLAATEVPVVSKLECPSCSEMKGSFKFPFGFGEGEEVFSCSTCEGTQFEIGRDKCLCTSCGSDIFWDDICG